MLAKEPLIIDGQPIGKIKAGWLLFKETWRFLMLDRELLWVPVISAVANTFFFGALIGIIVILAIGFDVAMPEDSPLWMVFMFSAYVIGAFILAFSQAAISHIVYVRAHGGDATLHQGLAKAMSHWGSLLIWSLITSTVGMVLRLISERSEFIGKIVTLVLGAAWGILTYFVVPAMVIDNATAFSSIPKSASVFKQTWGETVVSNISYTIVFMLIALLLMLSAVGLVVLALMLELPFFVLIILFVWLGAFIFLCLISSIFAGILKTLLYIYAVEGAAPANFNHELLEKMLRRTSVKAPAASPS